MDKPFEPAMYKDEYQERLKELIEKKIAGKEVVAASTSKEAASNVIDLMDALKKSVEQAKPTSKKKTTKKTTKKNKGA